MSKSPRRDLVVAQVGALDRMADRDPDATVIGWTDTPKSRGPVVHTGDGKIVVVNVTGYTKKY